MDTTAPYGVPLAYTVRATLEKNPKVEGLPAEELVVVPRDTYPPPAPARLDALSEPSVVRLLWDPVDAADLAGYLSIGRRAAGRPPRLTPAPVVDPFFNDTTVRGRHPLPLHRPLGRPRRKRKQPLPAGCVAEPF